MRGGGLLLGMKPDAPPGTGEGFAVALCVLAICILTTVASARIAGLPYQPPPLKVAVKSDKDTARVPRLVMVEYIKPPAAQTWVPMPWTCSEIRAYRKTHTDAEMEAKARENRLTPQQRAAAEACLKEKRT